MGRTVKIILLVAVVLYLAGCHQDNRKRIKTPVIDPKLKDSPQYLELRDIILWHLGTERYGDVYQTPVADPNLPKPVKR